MRRYVSYRNCFTVTQTSLSYGLPDGSLRSIAVADKTESESCWAITHSTPKEGTTSLKSCIAVASFVIIAANGLAAPSTARAVAGPGCGTRYIDYSSYGTCPGMISWVCEQVYPNCGDVITSWCNTDTYLLTCNFGTN